MASPDPASPNASRPRVDAAGVGGVPGVVVEVVEVVDVVVVLVVLVDEVVVTGGRVVVVVGATVVVGAGTGPGSGAGSSEQPASRVNDRAMALAANRSGFMVE